MTNMHILLPSTTNNMQLICSVHKTATASWVKIFVRMGMEYGTLTSAKSTHPMQDQLNSFPYVWSRQICVN